MVYFSECDKFGLWTFDDYCYEYKFILLNCRLYDKFCGYEMKIIMAFFWVWYDANLMLSLFNKVEDKIRCITISNILLLLYLCEVYFKVIK